MVKFIQMLKDYKYPAGALHIIQTLKDQGFKCYLVGGSVRDILLGRTPAEWDLTTDAPPETVSRLFHKVVPTGIEFGTVTVLVEDGTFEVTTFRRDELYTDGRHPSQVKYSKKLEEDLSRRDFTVNAMAYDPTTDEFIDKYEGQKDLSARSIRTVGKAVDRFSEDGLRSLRACRFAAQLTFEIEEKTFAAIGQTLQITKKVAVERVHDELAKMLSAPKPSIGIEYMRKSGLLKLFVPELELGLGVEQPAQFHKWDVYYHALYSCDAAPADNLPVRLAALLHDIAKPLCKVEDTFYGHDQKGREMAEDILRRLRFSNEHIEKVGILIANHMFNYQTSWSDAAVRRFIRRVGLDNLPDLFALRMADTRGMEREIDSGYLEELQLRIDKILAEENALHVKDLKVDGGDVMRELDIPPGPKVGKVLEALLEKVLDDPALNEREKLLRLIRELQ
ncbi:MAG: HD domain-containing protein [Candidatus Margulisiibacteriota bacterium]